TVRALETRSMNWQPLLQGKTPKEDVLAAVVPADQHAVFFPSVDAVSSLLENPGDSLDSLTRAMRLKNGIAEVSEKYQRQLCLSLSELTKQIASLGVRSVAFTGSDPSFDMGTDVAVLLETQIPEAVQLFLTAQFEAVKRTTPEAVSGGGS